ncbi:MAG: hypothetical protein ABEI77_02800 [Halorientalis sp.]
MSVSVKPLALLTLVVLAGCTFLGGGNTQPANVSLQSVGTVGTACEDSADAASDLPMTSETIRDNTGSGPPLNISWLVPVSGPDAAVSGTLESVDHGRDNVANYELRIRTTANGTDDCADRVVKYAATFDVPQRGNYNITVVHDGVVSGYVRRIDGDEDSIRISRVPEPVSPGNETSPISQRASSAASKPLSS